MNFMGSRYNWLRGCNANHPGMINMRPMALEEQLAQVSSFMYSQCASMNIKYLRMSSIEEVDISDKGVARATGNTMATAMSNDGSVIQRLIFGLKNV